MDLKVLFAVILVVVVECFVTVAGRQDYYEMLGVRRRATESEIRKAFRNLAKIYHPDKNKAAGSQKRFQEIAEAYEVLSDKEKRQGYDQHGHDFELRRRQQRYDWDDHDIFHDDFFGSDDMFEMGGGPRYARQQQRQQRRCRKIIQRVGRTLYTYTECFS